MFWAITKSWKLADWELNINKEYKIVTNISKEITWTRALTVPIIAYLDWLNKPTKTNNIFAKRTKTKWYNIKESTFSKTKSEGPQIKFCENKSCIAYNKERKIGARAVVGRGIKKISFVNKILFLSFLNNI